MRSNFQIPKSRCLLGSILRQTQKKSFEDVILVLNQTLSQNELLPHPHLVNNILYYYEVEEKYNDGVELAEKLFDTNFVWNTSLLVIVLRMYCCLDKLDKAMEILDRLASKFTIHQRDISPILKYCFKNNKKIEGEKVWKFGKEHNVNFSEKDYFYKIYLSHKNHGDVINYLDEVSEIYPTMILAVYLNLNQIMFDYKKISIQCSINNNDGECSQCHSKLENHTFTNEHKDQLMKNIKEKIIAERDDRGVTNSFQNLLEFLQKSSSVDYVIDGANVGYYGLSHWNPVSQKNIKQKGYVDTSVNYQLIAKMIDLVIKQNKKPLVILHERHYSNPKISKEDKNLLEQWEKDGILYLSSKILNDDICWMYASLYHKAFVISNDQMRDHHFKMMSHKLFIRWKDMYRIPYRLDTREMELTLYYPLPYAQKIQYNEQKKILHIPIRNDSDKISWMCIQ